MSLFVGAFIQFALGAAAVRFCSVVPSGWGVGLTTALGQLIWWTNIQGVMRTHDPLDGALWILGAVCGSLWGFFLVNPKEKTNKEKR